VKFPHAADVPVFWLRNVTDFAIHNSPGLPEMKRAGLVIEGKL
jgi:hypothetical protein